MLASLKIQRLKDKLERSMSKLNTSTKSIRYIFSTLILIIIIQIAAIYFAFPRTMIILIDGSVISLFYITGFMMIMQETEIMEVGKLKWLHSDKTTKAKIYRKWIAKKLLLYAY